MKESHLRCNPFECKELEEWLLRQMETYEQTAESLTFASKQKEAQTI